MKTPEVLRVYISSFWDKAQYDERGRKMSELFDDEKRDLLADLRSLPRNSTTRKINEIVKRARSVKVHAYLISSLKARMPLLFGKTRMQEWLVENLEQVFWDVQRTHGPSSAVPMVHAT